MAFRARGGHPSGSPLRLLLRLAGLLVILVCSVYLTEIKQSLAAATVYSQAGGASGGGVAPGSAAGGSGTASAVALSKQELEQRCHATLGGWCRGFLQQQPIPAKPPPRYNQSCLWGAPATCNFVGVCNHQAGWCNCPAGWTGDDCSTRLKRPCSERYRRVGFEPHEGGSNAPLSFDGNKGVYSHCAGVCDEDTGHCFCRAGTKYERVLPSPRMPPGTPPEKRGRPMSWHCQPSKNDDGKAILFGDKEPDSLWGPQGWCQADSPSMPDRCPCIMDGYCGQWCDVACEMFCSNQCNGHGDCNMGFCKCQQGWWGHDCAQLTGGTEWSRGAEEGERPWLQGLVHTPAARDPPPGATRRRPLIYVYELPGRYNTAMLQYRPDRGTCVHRFFQDGNATAWNDNWGYVAETGLHEALLQSEHRTLDPEEADFFYIPAYTSCYIFPIHSSHDMPFFHSMHAVTRVHGTVNMLIDVHHWIRTHLPYWDRRGGRDHIILQSHDEGSCWLPAVLRPAILLTHWGRMGRGHTSSTGYWPDDYSRPGGHGVYMPEGTEGKLGDFPCYDPEKDLVIPPMASPLKYSRSPLVGAPPPDRSRFFAFFKGRTQQNNPKYSRGIRQTLENLCRNGSWPEKHNIHIGEGLPGGVASYSEALASSTFCLVLPGDGFSPRMEDAMHHGCIPVIIQDQVHLAFESVLDYDTFALRVAQQDMARLPDILLAVPQERRQQLLAGVAAVWRRFTYTGYKPYGAVQRGIVREYARHSQKQEQEQQGKEQGQEGQQAGSGSKAGEGGSEEGGKGAEHAGQVEEPEVDVEQGDALDTIYSWLHSRIPHTRGRPPQQAQAGGNAQAGGGGSSQQRTEAAPAAAAGAEEAPAEAAVEQPASSEG